MKTTIRELKAKLPLKHRSSAYHILSRLPILPAELNGVNYRYDLQTVRHYLKLRNTRSKRVRYVVNMLIKVIDEELANKRSIAICGISK